MSTRSHILSLCLSGHGFSGCLCIDGSITVATSLERLSRKKNDILLPITSQDLETFGWHSNPELYKQNINLPFDFALDPSSIDFSALTGVNALLDYLLSNSSISHNQIDAVVYSYRYIPQVKRYFTLLFPNAQFIVPEHHESHSCQAFYSSPFESSAIMIVDGQGVPMERTYGDQLAGCLAFGQGTDITTLKELPVRHSLGGMYSSFTSKIGFKTNEEGKTMGLAAYGTDSIYTKLRKNLSLRPKKLSRTNLKQILKGNFNAVSDFYSLPDYIQELSHYTTRTKGTPITQIHCDLAYAVQKLTEDVLIYLANWLYDSTHSPNLTIAGGVGLNCVANYQVLIHSPFENIFIHPNPGDNGLVVGQALWAYTRHFQGGRNYEATNDYLGKEYSQEDIESALDCIRDSNDLSITHYSDLKDLCDTMAHHIAGGKITSWYQGRSEFGPRALGNRSILADPRNPNMKDILNSRVKFRESFRPFTPSVIADRCSEYFELDIPSPFMLHAAYVRPHAAPLVPAITHYDNTARIQTVSHDDNPRYFELISAFERLTSIPMLLDTSFNIADEPIVETPSDAVRCFLSTDIDVLCIGDYIITKLTQ